MKTPRTTQFPGGQASAIRAGGTGASKKTGFRKGDAFSLVELLAVMAIVALLSGATAVMFSGGRSVGINTSAARISGVLTMARDLAITSNRLTRFVVVTDAASNPAELRLKSYGVLQYDMTLGKYVQASPLQQLPTGVFFDEDPENEASGRGIFDAEDKIAMRGAEIEYAYVEFLPAGGTTATSGSNIFSLVGGAAPGQAIAGSKDYARLGVAQHTGRVRVERQ